MRHTINSRLLDTEKSANYLKNPWTFPQVFAFMGGMMITLAPKIVLAQISADETLGAVGSFVTPNVEIKTGVTGDRIDGGVIKESNLFHSFREFNVKNGQQVYFANPSEINNILGRVTGKNPSNILGTLGVNGNANLFFINPNGIIFGQNARLDIGGSFIASTASSLKFADGTEFSAAAPEKTPLLTVSVPIGLQFAGNAGNILVQGNGRGLRRSDTPILDTKDALRVPSNRTLALVGGNVALEGGTLKTAEGRIELGSVAGTGLVSLTPNEKGFSLGYEGVSNFGDISFSKATAVDASGIGGGEIQIRGRRVTLKDGSQVESTSIEGGRGGKLIVTASELVELSGTTADNPQDNRRFPSSFSTDNRENGKIPGELIINTQKLILRNGGRISASNSTDGVGGGITINASDSVSLIGTFTASGGLRPSGISVQTRGSGNAGKLTVNTRNLQIRDGAELSASTFSSGNGGDIELNVLDAVELIGTSANGQLPSKLVAEVGNLSDVDRGRNSPSTPATGKGGDIRVNTRNLTVRNGAEITVSATRGKGTAGNLAVNANTIRLNQGKLTAETNSGEGANITVENLKLLRLEKQSLISAQAFNQAKGGNITINAPNGFIVAFPNQNNDIIANAFQGEGGKINITALALFNLAERKSFPINTSNDIDASSQFGLAGEVILNTPDIDPNSGLIELPEGLVDASQQIASSCKPGDIARRNSFTVTGRGGIAPSPVEPLQSEVQTGRWVTLNSALTSSQSHTSPISHIQTPIIEAQGWIRDNKGDVILIAQSSNITPHQALNSKIACSGNP
jgi:filamentous hemagglutinin family protein